MKFSKSWKTYLTVLLILPVGFAAWGIAEVARVIPSDTFLSMSEAKKMWGESPFDAEKFRNGDESVRASMAVSILKNPKIFMGKTPLELREILGTPTGFYHFDMNPAYIVSESDKPDGDTWQLLFLIDRHYKIKSVKIHKN